VVKQYQMRLRKQQKEDRVIAMQRKMKRPGRSIPLYCVDKCLLALDGINEPMIIHSILNLEGEIDCARWVSHAIIATRV